MYRFVLLCLLLLPSHTHAQAACTHWASSSGGGNGRSPASPFHIADFWPVARPGMTLCLLDGTYSGHQGLITPPPSFAGTASQPITIRALNDGKVLINGGHARPVDLRGAYGILEGINARGGNNGSIQFRGSHWIARRVVAWNAAMDVNQDSAVIGLAGDNNVLEDCAAFGLSRGVLRAGAGVQGPSHNVIRRCWVRFEQRAPGMSPTLPVEIGYGQQHVTMENILATRDRVPGTPLTGPEAAILVQQTQDSAVYGSIAYATAQAVYDAGQLFTVYGDLDRPTRRVTLKDVVAYAPPGSRAHGAKAFDLYANTTNGHRAENLVGVSSRKGTCESAGWAGCGSLRWGTSLAAAIGAGKSLWQEVPGICRRYVNGQLTTQPLWPWPLNQRIKDALGQSGRAAVDITRTMEDLFGPIPAQCRGAGSSEEPPVAALPAPRNLRVLSAQ